MAAKSVAVPAVQFVEVDKALESLRSSGHSLTSAVGEVIDNSLEAGANNIRVRLFTAKKKVGKNKRATEVVERIAVGDDGCGMDNHTHHNSLKLGFSSRYNCRKGIGRFGVGAKLAGISQGRRIEVYSRTKKTSPWKYTYIDLDEIGERKLSTIPAPRDANPPKDCIDLVGDSEGTLVIWAKGDHLEVRESGSARRASSVESELVQYVSRTYRKFLDAGIKVFINKTLVKPHDPLFLMTSTRFHDAPDPDPIATEILRETFKWPVPTDAGRESEIEVVMTLLPEQFRPKKGAGGSKDAKERRIDENEGASILRAGREIFFGTIRGVQPSVENIDRWVGIEISFQPDLDECFAVRNVKKGAEPVNGLRDKLKDVIHKTVETGRKHVRSHYAAKTATRRQMAGVHAEAEEVANKVSAVSPKSRAGSKISEDERNAKIAAAAKALTKDRPDDQEAIEAQIRTSEFKIVPDSWPGNEFVDIDHLGSNVIVKLNTRHAFYRTVYSPVIDQVEKEAKEDVKGESLAKTAQVGLDLLILAYARAEGMCPSPDEEYGDLRTYWGVHLKTMIDQWLKG